MKPKTIFAIIGAGSISRRQHIPNLIRSPLIELKSVCDLKKDLLKRAQEEYHIPHIATDYRQILRDSEVQAVIIATRDGSHAPLTMDALKAGKNVYVEKPLANTEEQCRKIVALQKRVGKFVCVGYNRRFAPAYQKARGLILHDGGAKNIHYRISDGYGIWAKIAAKLGEELYQPLGNRLLFEVCHIFDIIRWLAGSDVESVYCVESRKEEEAILLRLKSGCVATIMTSGYATVDMPKERLEVITDAGGVTVEEFCELRSFGYKEAQPVYRFAGHSHPGTEFTHKYLLEKLGETAMFAIRRNGWEMVQKLSFLSKDPDMYFYTHRKSQDMAAGIKTEFFEKEEIAKYVAYEDGVAPIYNYMVDKGWVAAVESLARCIQNGKDNPDNASAEDGLKATRIAHAAVKSRETGRIVKLQGPSR